MTTTVDGQPAIELSEGRAAVYIATTGRPYPLEIRQGSHNVLHFQYSALPVSIAAPPRAVDLSSCTAEARCTVDHGDPAARAATGSELAA